MEVFKVTACSRQPNRYDVTVNGAYTTFLDAVTAKDAVDVLSRTPHLTILTVDGERVAVEKNRDKEDRFTVTVTASSETDAVGNVELLVAETNVVLKA